MEQYLIPSVHLLLLTIAEDYSDHKSDSDTKIRLNLGSDASSSQDEREYLSYPINTRETMRFDQLSTVSTTGGVANDTQHKCRQWVFAEKLKIISEWNTGVSLQKLELKYKCELKDNSDFSHGNFTSTFLLTVQSSSEISFNKWRGILELIRDKEKQENEKENEEEE